MLLAPARAFDCIYVRGLRGGGGGRAGTRRRAALESGEGGFAVSMVVLSGLPLVVAVIAVVGLFCGVFMKYAR